MYTGIIYEKTESNSFDRPTVIDGYTAAAEQTIAIQFVYLLSWLPAEVKTEHSFTKLSLCTPVISIHRHACHQLKNNTERAGGKRITKNGFGLQTCNHVCQIHPDFNMAENIIKFHKAVHKQRKPTTWGNIRLVNQFCSDKGSQTLEETTPLPLYCLALCNRHSWWGRWHRRRICHNFVAEAATVTIGTSALQNVTANGPADRKSKHSLRSQS